jgi:hypothetical protein
MATSVEQMDMAQRMSPVSFECGSVLHDALADFPCVM